MIRILQGDARLVLRDLAANSVHACITSPPYYALRRYLPAEHPNKHAEIGQEQSPDEYVAELVTVFREVRRVLHPSGVVLLNLGDSYANSASSIGNAPSVKSTLTTNSGNGPKLGDKYSAGSAQQYSRSVPSGYKPKDLLGIPWQVALALRADGWWLRSAIVWNKLNPMPESCTDRPTSSYEMVFVLAKEARYFWDADAVAETASSFGRPHTSGEQSPKTRALKDCGLPGHGGDLGINYERALRNARNVLTMANEPYAESHFAVMPSALAEWCIRAGTSEAGCCPHCLAPWQRIVERGAPDRDWQRACGGDADGEYAGQSIKDHDAAGVQNASEVKRRILEGMREKRTTGWRPTCDCPEHTPRACTVLDPFSGAGTTLLAADRLRRDAIGVELNSEYVAMSERRLRGDAGLFAEVSVA